MKNLFLIAVLCIASLGCEIDVDSSKKSDPAPTSETDTNSDGKTSKTGNSQDTDDLTAGKSTLADDDIIWGRWVAKNLPMDIDGVHAPSFTINLILTLSPGKVMVTNICNFGLSREIEVTAKSGANFTKNTIEVLQENYEEVSINGNSCSASTDRATIEYQVLRDELKLLGEGEPLVLKRLE